MAILKCKMCGGDLEVAEEIKIVECEYCGTKQTVPNADNEKKINLFNRANRLRMASEFDKAAGIYENIIAEFPEEAEAYWGLCLCNYGIEYVDDPATAKKIPTCHRASFESLQKDENYELALEYADVVAQKLYRDEAREIDRIMNEILAVSKNEKPYDVFICYKETDDKGGRTVDSVLAYDIYEALTAKGFNVFFARVTLEDKLGMQYEPYIFAALNSAKVMLSIGTKYEYFHAVWVKNEWSRFLKLMAKDKSKMLIPCFKDIDPYDMPEKFKGLQAQDLGKLGAVQDIVRGVEKILGKEQKVTVVTQQKVVNGPNIESLLKRGNLFLEDKDWAKANEYAEKVLDSSPECAEAYLVKLLADLKVRNMDELRALSEPYDGNPNYYKLWRFASDELKEELIYSIRTVIYRKAEGMMKKAKTEKAYAEVAEKFEMISGFKDADEKASEYRQKEKDLKELREAPQKRINAARERSMKARKLLVAGGMHLVGLKTDGTVVATGSNKHGQCNVSNWTNIIAIVAGENHTVGLKSDGTVVATGKNKYGQCDTGTWKNITAIATNNNHTVGLRSDGTVVATGKNKDGQCDTGDWRDIVSVEAGLYSTVGLKKDGTAVAKGYIEKDGNVGSFKDVKTLYASTWNVAGVKANGDVDITGESYHNKLEAKYWHDIVDISLETSHVVGLKRNGTVVAVGENKHKECDVGDWKNIVAIDSYIDNSFALDAFGKVTATSYSRVPQWTDIIAIATRIYFMAGLKDDGTVVIDTYRKEFDTSAWKLFESFENIEEERKRKSVPSVPMSEQYRRQGLCRHCGGTFKGMFSKKCTNCGKEKDY